MATAEDLDVDAFQDLLEPGQISLLLAPTEDVFPTTKTIIRHFVDQDAIVVYVTVSRPYTSIAGALDEDDISSDRIFYVDGATKLAGSSTVTPAENVVYVDPQNLTDLSISMKKAVESVPDDNEVLLIFDALSTLMIYNDMETVSKFAHALTSKMRDWENVISILLTMSAETDEEMRSRLSGFCDHVYRLEDLADT